MESIGEVAFEYCSILSSVTFLNGMTTIDGGFMFEDCGGTITVNIPNSVTTINNQTFYGVNITNITIDKEENSIPGYENKWGAPERCHITVTWLR